MPEDYETRLQDGGAFSRLTCYALLNVRHLARDTRLSLVRLLLKSDTSGGNGLVVDGVVFHISWTVYSRPQQPAPLGEAVS